MNRHPSKPIQISDKQFAESLEVFKTFMEEANKWLKSVLSYVHGETPEQAAKRSRLVEKQFSPLSRN